MELDYDRYKNRIEQLEEHIKNLQTKLEEHEHTIGFLRRAIFEANQRNKG